MGTGTVLPERSIQLASSLPFFEPNQKSASTPLGLSFDSQSHLPFRMISRFDVIPSSIMIMMLIVCCWMLTDVTAARHSGILNGITGVSSHTRTFPWVLRGGSTASVEVEDVVDDETTTDDITKHAEFAALQAYRMEQNFLMQLRATYLSEALVRRGLPLVSIEKVATPDGAKPPEKIDWDCALSTEEDPKMCLFSFNTEPNTKVIGPTGSKDWISLRALNKLRRTDPTKVESMWHMKYAILKSWFDPDSEFSLLQHVSLPGFLLNELLQGYRLHAAVGASLLVAIVLFMPVIEYMINRILVSSIVWARWPSWYRFVHAALPLKLLLGQMAFKYLSYVFIQLVGMVKEMLVELECEILEQSIPLTLGVPDIVPPGKLTGEEFGGDDLGVPMEDQDDEGDESDLLEEDDEESDE